MKIIIFSLFLTIVMGHNRLPLCLDGEYFYSYGKQSIFRINSFYPHKVIYKIDEINDFDEKPLDPASKNTYKLLINDLLNIGNLNKTETQRFETRIEEKDFSPRLRSRDHQMQVTKLFEFAKDVFEMVKFNKNMKHMNKTKIEETLSYAFFDDDDKIKFETLFTDHIEEINISVFKKIHFLKIHQKNTAYLVYDLLIPTFGTCANEKLGKLPTFYENLKTKNTQRAIPQIHDKKLSIVQAENQYQQKNPYKYDMLEPLSSY